MSSEWNKLRSYHGSVNSAFEELCCQLARHQKISGAQQFVRKGVPDAGLECYWTLDSGEEYGWQAKFFDRTVTRVQWRQLEDSFTTALQKHPRLTKYTVCLPFDRADPRVPERTALMEEWNNYVVKWEATAKGLGRKVVFDYWGDSEIFERLSKDEHRGRALFWFDAKLLGRDWFKSRLETAIANAGEKYTPDVHVNLKISHTLEALARVKTFWDRLTLRVVAVRDAWDRHLGRRSRAKEHPLAANCLALVDTANRLRPTEEGKIDFSSMVGACQSFHKRLTEHWIALEAQLSSPDTGTPEHPTPRLDDASTERHYLNEISNQLEELRSFLTGSEPEAAAAGALLVYGAAGMGKTHLFCHVAEKLIAVEKPAVLLLGDVFTAGGTWDQVTRQLAWNGSSDDFIAALDVAGETAGCRAVLFIDALNEGDGLKVWPSQLAGFLTRVSRYPHIAVALSVRDVYLDSVIPSTLGVGVLPRIKHRGFSENTDAATRAYFGHYGVALPDFPTLDPEFRNPLFLKLFCSGLQNRRMRTVPAGLRGVTRIFEFFIDSINAKLAHPSRLDFDAAENRVGLAMKRLAAEMARVSDDYLTRDQATTILQALHPSTGYEKSLLRQLISEGLLTKSIHYDWDGQASAEVVRFVYQRLSDHLIVAELLRASTSREGKLELGPGSPLGQFFGNMSAWYSHSGWVQALAIQLPENHGIEIANVVPGSHEDSHLVSAFTESLLWRRPETVTDSTLQCIRQHFTHAGGEIPEVLDAFINVTGLADHPFNAKFLDAKLRSLAMPDRDAWWSIYLFQQREIGSPVERLIEWAWDERDRSHLTDETIELCATTLMWFHTTSHRYLRDRATKALVSLLEGRSAVLRRVLEQFGSVDDLYVRQRLYAVAYGCTMREMQAEARGQTAELVYNRVFAHGSPEPSVHVRTFARGVIEAALAAGVAVRHDAKKTVPPFASVWPDPLPSLDELKRLYRADNYEPLHAGLRQIYHSVSGGDFSHYVLGRNMIWTRHRLNVRRPRSITRRVANFRARNRHVESLLKRYEQIRMEERALTTSRLHEILDGISLTSRNFQQETNSIADEIVAALSPREAGVFRKVVRPDLDDVGPGLNENYFPMDFMRRAILARVLQLGYTSERFNPFDAHVSHRGRDANKPERLGKKYQWIAYDETLAQIADNFSFEDGSAHLEIPGSRTEGNWMVESRDIDPSLLLRGNSPAPRLQREWWLGKEYDQWARDQTDIEWMKNADDLPNLDEILRVQEPGAPHRWLVLDPYREWKQSEGIGEMSNARPSPREIFFMFFPFLVAQKDADKFERWAVNAEFTGRWVPEPRNYHEYCLHEFFWAPPFQIARPRWTHGRGWLKNRIPVPVMSASAEYCGEARGFDCSLDHNISIKMPAQIIVEDLGLTMRGRRGEWYDPAGERVAFDPTAGSGEYGATLIREDAMDRFLLRKKLKLYWTFVGEKNVYPPEMHTGDDQWLGRLEFYGVRWRQGDGWAGKMSSKFATRGS